MCIRDRYETVGAEFLSVPDFIYALRLAGDTKSYVPYGKPEEDVYKRQVRI